MDADAPDAFYNTPLPRLRLFEISGPAAVHNSENFINRNCRCYTIYYQTVTNLEFQTVYDRSVVFHSENCRNYHQTIENINTRHHHVFTVHHSVSKL